MVDVSHSHVSFREGTFPPQKKKWTNSSPKSDHFERKYHLLLFWVGIGIAALWIQNIHIRHLHRWISKSLLYIVYSSIYEKNTLTGKEPNNDVAPKKKQEKKNAHLFLQSCRVPFPFPNLCLNGPSWTIHPCSEPGEFQGRATCFWKDYLLGSTRCLVETSQESFQKICPTHLFWSKTGKSYPE